MSQQNTREIVPQDIIDFWYSDEVSKLWFNSAADFDWQLRVNYFHIW